VHGVERRRTQVHAAHVGQQDAVALHGELVLHRAGVLHVGHELLAVLADGGEGALDLAQLGRVHERAAGEVDEHGRVARVLARRLRQQFEEVVERLGLGATAAHQQRGDVEAGLGQVLVQAGRAQRGHLGEGGLGGLGGLGLGGVLRGQ